MKTRLVSMGNSRGVRLPKPLIEEAGIEEEVEVHVREGEIVIAAVHAPRAGWAEAAERLAREDERGLLDPPVSTRFDDDEWQW